MSLIPNSWQTPNDFMDKYNPFLTSEEWRVLSYACRHILGWQDKIDSRMRRMSLSMFENGFLQYPGCGLSRPAIIKALNGLAQFHLLIKVGEATQSGQMWKIPLIEEEIDLDGLKSRQQENRKKAVSRTNQARQASGGGKSDLPLVSPIDHERSVPLTGGGKSHLRNQSQVQSQPSKPNTAAPIVAGGGVSKSSEVEIPDNTLQEKMAGESPMGETPTAASAKEPTPGSAQPPPVNAADLAEEHIQTLPFNKSQVFDCVAWGSFGIKDVRSLRVNEWKGKKADNPGTRIGMIKAWLVKQYSGSKETEIAERVVQFYLWYRRVKKDLAAPKQVTTFSEAWLEWEQVNLPDPFKSKGTGAWSLDTVTGGPLRNAKGFSQEELDAAKARAKEGVLS